MLNKKNYIKPFKITKQPLKHPKFAGKGICNRMNSGGVWVHAPAAGKPKKQGCRGGFLLCVFLNRR